MNKIIEADRTACPSRDDARGELFDEGPPIAGRDGATETARRETDDQSPTVGRKVPRRPNITAVHRPGQHPAPRTRAGRPTPMGMHDQAVWPDFMPVNDQSGRGHREMEVA